MRHPKHKWFMVVRPTGGTEAAEFLRVEPAAVARAIRLGQLPFITVDEVVLVVTRQGRDGPRLELV